MNDDLRALEPSLANRLLRFLTPDEVQEHVKGNTRLAISERHHVERYP